MMLGRLTAVGETPPGGESDAKAVSSDLDKGIENNN